jgi:hypothetical protein
MTCKGGRCGAINGINREISMAHWGKGKSRPCGWKTSADFVEVTARGEVDQEEDQEEEEEDLEMDIGILEDVSLSLVENWGMAAAGGFSSSSSTRAGGKGGVGSKAGAAATCRALRVVPKDCELSSWSAWGPCSTTCGPGTQRRTRQILKAAVGGGVCPELEQVRACPNNPECPINCEVSDWEPWSECSEPCGGGKESRTRTVTQDPLHGGQDCPELREERACNTNPCPVDCEVTDWTAWGTCSKVCGGGEETRTRRISRLAAHGGTACPTPAQLVDKRACNTQPCPVACVVGDWGAWGPCSAQCGPGTQTRQKPILVQAAHGGTGCPPPAQLTETRACKLKECPVDCKLGGWGPWSGCSKTCGGGTRTRPRIVETQPAHGGKACEGPMVETQACNAHHCPVDCQYTDWTAWSACPGEPGKPVVCGKGVQTSSRAIKVPSAHGGKECTEPLQKSQPCDTKVPCPVDCKVSEWSAWGPCSAPCGGGTRTRSRTVDIAAAHGGKACPALRETIACNSHSCPVDCVVGDFGNWSPCTEPCGGGVETRTRDVKVANAHGGKLCPALSESRACNTQPCPVDCVVGEFGEWGECSRSCGGGEKIRTRAIVTAPAHEGKPCPPLTQKESCNTRSCPVDCKVTEWGQWGECDQPCGPGQQKRMRSVSTPSAFGGAACPPASDLEETRACQIKECPVDCVMTEWSQWSNCSAECGEGEQTRSRTVVTPAKFGGAACGASIETRKCIVKPCPKDCKVSEWEPWTDCTKSCGGGTMTRKRTVAEPAQFGGSCPSLEETIACNEQPCPVDCKLTEWEGWSACSVPCGGGKEERVRSIVTAPMYGGKQCGDLREERACNTQSCPVDCVTSEWGEWTACTKSCGGGAQTRSKQILRPAQYGGKACPAVLTETRSCNEAPCPVNCKVSEWSGWGDCSVTCGGGTQRRTKEVLTPMAHDGMPCPDDLVETRACNTDPCPVDCKLGDWSSWSTCTEPCGRGEQTRSMPVLKDSAHGGTACPTPEERLQKQACNPDPCPVDCEVGNWTEWSECSAECGEGTRTRTRSVTKAPMFNGRPCPALLESQSCIDKPCPLDCRVSDWTAWTDCSKSCGGGERNRERTIETPALHGGKCYPLKETEACNTDPCPVDCETSDWTEWGACSRECGGGKKLRTRSILKQAAFGGKACPIPELLVEEMDCNTQACADEAAEVRQGTAAVTGAKETKDQEDAKEQEQAAEDKEEGGAPTALIIGGVVAGFLALAGLTVWLRSGRTSAAQ